ncbi:MAG: sigma factor [Planctomycetota bacterium]
MTGGKSDVELVRAVLTDLPGAKEALGERLLLIPRILRCIDRRNGYQTPPQDLDDMAQGAFLVVWSKLDQFNGPGDLDPWVYRICYFQFQNYRRARWRANWRASTTGDLPVEAIMDPESDRQEDPG